VSWVRLDDGFAEHPKVARLDDRAFRLLVWCLCYSARQLTDGFVDDQALRRSPFGARATRLVVTLGRLADAGLIKRVEGGIEIHDFGDYNPDRASVLKKREQARERQARWLEKKKKNQPSNNASTNASPNANPHPDPAPKGAGREAPPLGGAPPPNETPVFEAKGQPCFVCERMGLPVLLHAGQWFCQTCLADYDRTGGRVELGQVEPYASLAGEESAA
jgi:hypothetical protein